VDAEDGSVRETKDPRVVAVVATAIGQFDARRRDLCNGFVDIHERHLNKNTTALLAI
jgi:hypothetical protein